MNFNRLAWSGALLLSLAWTAPVAAQSSDLFIVRGVPVDASAASATEARNVAIAGGRAAAFSRLYRRLTRQADWPKEPKLDAAKLDALVQSFSVANERRSSTRYLADITYTFAPAQVRQTMSSTGIAFSESRAKPYVILPMLIGEAGPTLFGSDNPWALAWQSAGLGGELAPLIVPSGDVEDLAITPDVAASGDWTVFGPYAEKYEAGKIVVATATPSADGGLNVSLRVVTDIGQSSDTITVAPQPNDEPATLYGRAIAEINARLQEEWKNKTAVTAGAGTQLSAQVQFTTLGEWAGIRNRLQGTSLVQNVAVAGMSTRGAQVNIRYNGSSEQLAAALAENGLALTSMNGAWSVAMLTTPEALPGTPPGSAPLGPPTGAQTAPGTAPSTGAPPKPPATTPPAGPTTTPQ